MPYYYEGVANSEEEDKIQHEAFYNGKNSRIMTKEQYNKDRANKMCISIK
jgi:hypothetical protein